MPIFSLDLSNRSMVSDFPDAHPMLPDTVLHQIILPMVYHATGRSYYIILIKIITFYFCFALHIFLPDSMNVCVCVCLCFYVCVPS